MTCKIIVTIPNNVAAQYNRKIALKNSTLFLNCILKINSQLVEHAQDLDIVIPTYNLLYIRKSLKKLQDNFAIIIQTCQVQDIIIITEIEYFIQ